MRCSLLYSVAKW
uniref:Uncharacterized protein n=1 Tax=Anguilla anguilla TaxID=7936 RepID=A0A0E9XVE6_ANGAN